MSTIGKRWKRKGALAPTISQGVYDHSAIRQKIIQTLGGKCMKCGFFDWRALQVDHINGFPGLGRLSNAVLLLRDILESLSKKSNKYQLLCANCNWIKRYENQEHSLPSLYSDGGSVSLSNTLP